MKDQDVDFFLYRSSNEPQALYQKSQFLKLSDPNFRKQRRNDQIQLRTGLDFSGYGPSYSDFCKRIEALELER
jgi:hypothetical protein